MEKVVNELTGHIAQIEFFNANSCKDTDVLHNYLLQLTNIMARANYLMAVYKKKFREEKKAAYVSLVVSGHANQPYYAPSLAKDYIDSQCSDAGFVYDLAERLSRLVTHTIDSVRTIISSLKTDRYVSK